MQQQELLCAWPQPYSASLPAQSRPSPVSPATQTVQQALDSAKQLQGQGALREAKQAYEAVLRRMPGQPDALTFLASIAYQLGREQDGDALLDAAIESYAAILAHAKAQGESGDAVRAARVNLLLARGRQAEAEREIAKPKLPINPVRATPADFAQRLSGARGRGLPGILLNSLPKSASESIWNKLAEGLGMAQGHVSLGLFPDCCLFPHRVGLLAEGGLIAKEHIPATPHNLETLAACGIDKLVLNLRDPRQASLSWAHFVKNDVSMRLLAPIWRKIVPPRPVLDSDFPFLLDWVIERYLPLSLTWIAGWTEEMKRGDAATVRVHAARFETFREDPATYFSELLDFLEIERAAFSLTATAETVHLRRGATDEWRSVFSPEQAERAWAKIPAELAAAWGWTV